MAKRRKMAVAAPATNVETNYGYMTYEGRYVTFLLVDGQRIIQTPLDLKGTIINTQTV